MSQVDITFENGTEAHYLAVGDPETVWCQTSKLYVRKLVVTQADDLTWPTADECPIGGN